MRDLNRFWADVTDDLEANKLWDILPCKHGSLFLSNSCFLASILSFIFFCCQKKTMMTMKELASLL